MEMLSGGAANITMARRLVVLAAAMDPDTGGNGLCAKPFSAKVVGNGILEKPPDRVKESGTPVT